MPKISVKLQMDGMDGGPQPVTAQDLKELLVSSSECVKVVDVRSPEEFGKRHIVQSVNLPFSASVPPQLAEELHKGTKACSTFSVVFVAQESPDVDDFAAHQLIDLYYKAFTAVPPKGSVRILSGGFSNFNAIFGADSAFVFSS